LSVLLQSDIGDEQNVEREKGGNYTKWKTTSKNIERGEIKPPNCSIGSK
jgi:hypothetical protein